MSGIFGIIRRDGAPVDPAALAAMHCAMAHWGPDGGGTWLDGCGGLGQALLISTPEGPGGGGPTLDAAGAVLAVAARLDNRAELLRALGVVGERLTMSDGDLVRQAYQQWGDGCVERMYGDWAFAAWRGADRRLFVARDHFGNTSLYYYADPRVFAFASDRQALLDLHLASMVMDELYLAQILISWPAYHGERTIHAPIRRLPPAHTLVVTPDRVEARQYWFLERQAELSLPRRQDYVDAFRTLFDDAVRARIRCGPAAAAVGVTLSGGLDSSSVMATAAGLLRDGGRRLCAFTSVPLSDTRPFVGQRFGDEWPLAQLAAQYAGHVDLQPVPAAQITPIQAIRTMLRIHHEPGHAAGNAYWLLALEQGAKAQGCRVLLTGQLGNAGVSWSGSNLSLSLLMQLRTLGWCAWARQQAERALPPQALKAIRKYRHRPGDDGLRHTALRADVAARLCLWERRLDDPDEAPARTPLEERQWLMPGRSFVGALWAQMGAAHGLEIRDPTADARVLAFSFSVPDRVFRDPDTGLDRWLIRAAMAGRLPDAVRLNRQRGRQSGDLVPRLRATAAEVDVALAEIECGPAADYVDAVRLRQAWQTVQTEDTAEAFRSATIVLTRGIMAGLFVNEFRT